MSAAPAFDPQAAELMMDAIMNKGYSFKHFTEVTDQQLEAVYALAYRSINAGQIDKAETLLKWLVSMDHFENRFKIALGVVHQKKKDYKSAIECFALVTVMDRTNPVPPLRSAECYLALKDRDNAESAAKMAIDICGDEPEFAKWRARAELILKGIETRKNKEQKRLSES